MVGETFQRTLVVLGEPNISFATCESVVPAACNPRGVRVTCLRSGSRALIRLRVYGRH